MTLVKHSTKERKEPFSINSVNSCVTKKAPLRDAVSNIAHKYARKIDQYLLAM